MNCGITDAFNLGWKLVATVQGWGGEWLLDSYTVIYFYHKLLYTVRVIALNSVTVRGSFFGITLDSFTTYSIS